MPGVAVITGSIPGPSSLQQAAGATYFAVGQAERGDTLNPILVRSMAEYQSLLGARVSYGALFDDLTTFFAEGGGSAYVARVVGPAATSGTLQLMDRAGAPLATLRVDALSAGAWPSNVTVQIVDSPITGQFKVLVFYGGVLAESWGPFPDPATAAAKITANSSYVKVTNLASATVAPNNNPAVLAATALSAGTDDRASITAAMYVAALTRFVPTLGAGVCGIPGQDASVVGAGLIAHASGFARLAILCPPVGTTVAAARSEETTFRGQTGSEFAGFFWPWIKIPDGTGGTRTISPEGFIAGQRAETQIGGAGPWQAPAGVFGRARFAVDVEQTSDKATLDALNDDGVNTIRSINGVRLYGWRSLSTDTLSYQMLVGRDVMNYVAQLGGAALEQYVFEAVDGRGQLFARMTASLRAILEPIRQKGGLFERRSADGVTLIDPGYLIDTGPSVNTPTLLAQNKVQANVEMRVSPTAEMITLRITKVAFPSAL